MPTSTRTRPSEAGIRGPLVLRSTSASGFTLIELSIVLLILAIAVSFLVPRLRNVDNAALTSSAARLATTSRYLYEEAAFRRRPMRLNFDLDKHRYWVTVLNDDPTDPEFVLEDGELARPVILPGTVTFADVALPATGVLHEGIVYAEFQPEGYVDPLVVHLTNARHEFATLAIDPLTGRTRVAGEYVALDPARFANAGEGRPDTSDPTAQRNAGRSHARPGAGGSGATVE